MTVDFRASTTMLTKKSVSSAGRPARARSRRTGSGGPTPCTGVAVATPQVEDVAGLRVGAVDLLVVGSAERTLPGQQARRQVSDGRLLHIPAGQARRGPLRAPAADPERRGGRPDGPLSGRTRVLVLRSGEVGCAGELATDTSRGDLEDRDEPEQVAGAVAARPPPGRLPRPYGRAARRPPGRPPRPLRASSPPTCARCLAGAPRSVPDAAGRDR